jgi:hypothetical protein
MKTRFASLSLALAVVLLPAFVLADQANRTDAQQADLLGPIRSVSTRVERTAVDWHQPDSATIGSLASPGELLYDSTGNRITQGEFRDGQFHGATVEITRDENGRVIERIDVNEKGEVVGREVFGPFGPTEQISCVNGKQLARSTWSYDANGHVSESYLYDENGAVVGRDRSFSDASGNFKEQWDYGRNGSFLFHSVDTYDPKRDIWTFTTFDEDGSVKVRIDAHGNKPLSYWQRDSGEGGFGSGFFFDRVGNKRDAYNCHPDGTCDHITYYFSDKKSPNISRSEWRDRSGELKLAADHEYELDQYGNWTKQTIWIWTPELGERKLYETDYRTLTYWDQPNQR